MAKLMISKLNSTCVKTGKAIKVGDPIYWAKGLGAWIMAAGESHPAPKATAASAETAAFEARIAALESKISDLEYAISVLTPA